MIKAVLFDLDGTLLPLDEKKFTEAYFYLMLKKMSKYGYDGQTLYKAIWDGTKCMVLNDGSKSNEEVFFKRFAEIFGEESLNDKDKFDAFYKNDFDSLKDTCGFTDDSKMIIDELKKMGIRLILATNPIFPREATYKRTLWAGLNPSDFELITTYENSCYAKPNLKYYSDILEKCGLKASECLMVGNNVDEDMVASKLGLDTYLIPDYIINKNNVDINNFKYGSFKDLLKYIKG